MLCLLIKTETQFKPDPIGLQTENMVFSKQTVAFTASYYEKASVDMYSERTEACQVNAQRHVNVPPNCSLFQLLLEH